MKPSLLSYVCKHLLSPKYRTDKPESVSALVIHRWALGRTKAIIAAEDNKGIKEVKALKIALSGFLSRLSIQTKFVRPKDCAAAGMF